MEKSEEIAFGLNLKMVIALAFVPVADVVAAFEELESSPFFEEHRDVLDGYLDYFQNTWIGGFNRRGQRKPPMFSIERWNCYESVLNDLPKTNNYAEGFNRGFAALLSVHHPTIPKFVQGLLKEQILTSTRLEQFNASNVPPPKPEYVRLAARLKKAVERYGHVDTLDYLRGVAHCFSLK